MDRWKVTVLNIVAAGFLNHPLDLELIEKKIEGVSGTP